MINIEGFKAFYGDLIVKPVNGNEPFAVTGDFLYKPDCDCWYGRGESYPADICETVEADKVAELEALQSRHKEAMKLLEAAVADILSFDSRPCKLCKFGNATWIMPNHCEDCDSLEKTKTNWKWQHADRYEALKAKGNE